MTPQFQIIEDCLVAGTRNLFDACNKAAEHAGRCNGPIPTTEDVCIASIGFASEGLRGNVVVVGSGATVDLITPDDFECEHGSARGDVLAEFTNMLVGRLKQQVRQYGLHFMVGTPTNAIARGAEIQPPQAGEFAWHAFTLGRTQVYVRLEITFAEGFLLAPENRSAGPELESGIVLFEDLRG